jgi:hypothetical protein
MSTKRNFINFFIALSTALLLIASAPAVRAVDQVVTDPGDTGAANQFRAKLADLQNTGGGTLTFNVGTASIVLTQGFLVDLVTNTTIDGAGKITISGNDAMRLFIVRPGIILTLRNVTLTNAVSDGDGGAIFNNGTLNVTNCKFIDNQTPSNFSGGAIVSYGPLNITNSEFALNKGGGGGAVYPRFGNAVTMITGCNFHNNETTNTSGGGNGGAILVWDGAPVTINNSTFSNNKAQDGEGGAVFVTANSTVHFNNSNLSGNSTLGAGGAINNHGTVDLTNVTLSVNYAGTAGGGIYNYNGTATLNYATVTGNQTNFGGGGIYNDGGTLNLTNVTLSANTVEDFSSGNSGGGGIAIVNAGTATLTNVTLSGNSGYYGGGMWGGGGTTTLTNVTLSGNSAMVGGGIAAAPNLINVTFSGNSAASGGGIAGYPATIKNTLIVKGANGGNCRDSLGGTSNLSDDGTCGFGAGRDNVNNLVLGPLANNGGFTQTHLPGAGSAVIDDGTASGAPARDQRGYTRAGAAPDVGAVEVGGSLLPAPTSIVSMKTHGATSFGINLPLTGNGAVECRSGGANGTHQIVLSFASPVTLTSASITKGIGNVSSIDVNGSQVTVNLTGVANAQNIFTTLFDVSDGTNSNDITIPVGLLLGDTTGNGTVNSSDISQTKGQSGTVVSSGNFRTDITVNGSINSSDISTVKSKSGTALP